MNHFASLFTNAKACSLPTTALESVIQTLEIDFPTRRVVANVLFSQVVLPEILLGMEQAMVDFEREIASAQIVPPASLSLLYIHRPPHLPHAFDRATT